MPYMYILECADGTYYTGSTVNLEKRLWEHDNMLGANYTKKKHPVRLVYSEEYARVDEAFYREKQVQGWSHAKKKALIEGEYNKLPELAKNYTQYSRDVASPASTGSANGSGTGTSTASTGAANNSGRVQEKDRNKTGR